MANSRTDVRRNDWVSVASSLYYLAARETYRDKGVEKDMLEEDLCRYMLKQLAGLSERRDVERQ